MTNTRRVFISAVLALSSFAVAYAKSYDFALGATTAAGSVQLPAGTYTLDLKDNKATLKNADSGKTYVIDVTVASGAKKFSGTRANTKQEGGTEHLKTIDLAGSTNSVVFEK